LGYEGEVTVWDSQGTAGYEPANSYYASITATTTDPNGNEVQVGGLATQSFWTWVAPEPWWKFWAEQKVEVMTAVQTAWSKFTGDENSPLGRLWRNLGTDPIANQKILISTINGILHEKPDAAHTEFADLIRDTLAQLSTSGRSFGETAFDVGLTALVQTVKDNLQLALPSGGVTIPGVTDLPANPTIADLDQAVQQLALGIGKGSRASSLLPKYLKAEATIINPDKTADNSTLCSANLDVLLKGTIPPQFPSQDASASEWATLAGIMSQRIGHTVTFAEALKGSDVMKSQSQLSDGTMGIIHSSATKQHPDGVLINFIKLDGRVFLYDAATSKSVSLNGNLDYQVLDTTK
jgi:hypothetical protein